MTPLPLKPMIALGVVLLNECLSATVLLPYVGLLVAHLQNSPPEEAGYFSGILIGVFMLGQVLSCRYWGYISDRYGRRVPLMIGVFSSGFMMLGFGLSSHVWMCTFFRFFHGLLNGNVLVAKTVLADILDKTNETKGFTLVSLTFGFGSLFGPAVGGLLYDPTNSTATQWFGLNREGMFAHFPGLLPAIVLFAYSMFATVMCVCFVQETNRNAQPLPHWASFLFPCIKHKRHQALPSSESEVVSSNFMIMEPKYTIEGATEHDRRTDTDIDMKKADSFMRPANMNFFESTCKQEEVPHQEDLVDLKLEEEKEDEEEEMRTLQDQQLIQNFGYIEAFQMNRIRKVILLYMLICGGDIAFSEIFPLWAISKRSVGGIGCNSDIIGFVLLSNGVPCLVSNLLFHLACNALSEKMCLWRISLVFMAFAVLSTSCISYLPGIFQIPSVFFTCNLRQWFSAWAYSLITLLTARVAPKSCLGIMYGITQSCGAIVRCVVPIVITPLFAWSISGNHIAPFDHMFVFLLAAVAFMAAVFVSFTVKEVDDIACDVEVVIEDDSEGIIKMENIINLPSSTVLKSDSWQERQGHGVDAEHFVSSN